MRSLSRRLCSSLLSMQRAWLSSKPDPASTTTAKQVEETAGRTRKKWEDMLNSEFGVDIDIERSIQSGATLLVMLQFGNNSQQNMSLYDYTRLIKLAVHPSIFQQPLLEKINHAFKMKNYQQLRATVRNMYIMRNKIDADRNNLAWMLNLIVEQTFDELPPLDREIGMLNMLESEMVHPATFKKYLETYSKQPSDFKNHAEEIHWCYHRITVMAMLEQHLQSEEFAQVVKLEHYQTVVNRVPMTLIQYLSLMEDEANRLSLFDNNLNCNVMLYSIPFTSNVAVTKEVKERMGRIWQKVADSKQNSGIYLFNKILFNYRYFYFLFNRTDRFVANGFLANYLHYMFRTRTYRWNNYRHTMALMSFYHTIDLGVVYTVLAALNGKFYAADRMRLTPEMQLYLYVKTLGSFADIYCLNLDDVAAREVSDFININLPKLKSRYAGIVSDMINRNIELNGNLITRFDDADRDDEIHLHRYDSMMEMVPQAAIEKKAQKRLKINDDPNKPFAIGLELIRAQEAHGFYRLYPFSNRLTSKANTYYLNNLIKIFRVWMAVETPEKTYLLLPCRSLKNFVKFLNSETVVKLIESIICYPGFLDNLLLIDYAYRLHEGQQLSVFEETLAGVVKKAHLQFQEIFGNLKQAMLSYVSKEPGVQGSLYFKPSIWEFMQNFERNPIHFYEKRITTQRPMLYHDQKEITREQYVLTKDNIMLNAVHNPLSNYILENSELKDTVCTVLQNLKRKYEHNLATKLLANVVEYPFFADFIVEAAKSKVAVFVVDYSKLYSNTKDIMHHQIRLSVEHFRRKGYDIVEINYSEYTVEDRLDIIKRKFDELIK